MTPNELAAHHLRHVGIWRTVGLADRAEFHLKAALLVISRCSGGKTRDEAQRLLRFIAIKDEARIFAHLPL